MPPDGKKKSAGAADVVRKGIAVSVAESPTQNSTCKGRCGSACAGGGRGGGLLLVHRWKRKKRSEKEADTPETERRRKRTLRKNCRGTAATGQREEHAAKVSEFEMHAMRASS